MSKSKSKNRESLDEPAESFPAATEWLRFGSDLELLGILSVCGAFLGFLVGLPLGRGLHFLLVVLGGLGGAAASYLDWETLGVSAPAGHDSLPARGADPRERGLDAESAATAPAPEPEVEQPKPKAEADGGSGPRSEEQLESDEQQASEEQPAAQVPPETGDESSPEPEEGAAALEPPEAEPEQPKGMEGERSSAE